MSIEFFEDTKNIVIEYYSTFEAFRSQPFANQIGYIIAVGLGPLRQVSVSSRSSTRAHGAADKAVSVTSSHGDTFLAGPAGCPQPRQIEQSTVLMSFRTAIV